MNKFKKAEQVLKEELIKIGEDKIEHHHRYFFGSLTQNKKIELLKILNFINYYNLKISKIIFDNKPKIILFKENFKIKIFFDFNIIIYQIYNEYDDLFYFCSDNHTNFDEVCNLDLDLIYKNYLKEMRERKQKDDLINIINKSLTDILNNDDKDLQKLVDILQFIKQQ